MNREDIIRMAREAGCDEIHAAKVLTGIHFRPNSLERFAALVAAAQRPVAEPHKWVGLTEQEWERLVELYGDDPDILIRETEAKLREKNGGKA